MNLPALCVRRPVMTGLLMMALLVFGVLSYLRLPVSDLPNADFPTIQVSASLPGASPETMAASVATPLEKQFSTIAGVDSMTSTSGSGTTQITLQFDLDRNIDAAAQVVQAAISQAQRQLPPTMTTPPSYRNVNPAASPVFYLAVTSQTLPLSAVTEYAETSMGQRISTISGAAQVLVYGSQPYAVRVQVDPQRLAALGVGIDEVAAAVGQHNVKLPTGTLQGPEVSYTVEATGQLFSAAQYRPLVVAWRNGAPVRLEQLGTVIDSVQNNRVAAWFNGERGVVLAIQRQPGTNTIEVVDAIRRLLPTFRAQMPAGLEMSILYDRSLTIRESVAEVRFTLILALALVVLVIFLFLRNLPATIIPSLALPLSVIGTFPVMALLGFSLNNITLMALTLCVGFVVDDAIVMLENIARHLEMGKKPLAATLEGAREIGFTIVSMTISLVAVFIPVLFMGGILGRLLHEFAITIMAAVLLSGFVSLTLTPLMCSRILKPPEPQTHGRLYRLTERMFDGLRDAYDRSLCWVLAHGRVTMVAFALLTGVTAWMFHAMPKGFLPSEDTGQLFIFTEAAQNISFDAMAREHRQVAEIVRQDPNVAAVMAFIGASGSSQSLNLGRIVVRLKHRAERPSADEVIRELRPKLAHLPGIKAYIQNLPAIRIGGQLTKSPYQYTLQDADTAILYEWVPRIEARIKTLPGFLDVTTDLQITNPQVVVEIDRQKAAAVGVTPAQIETALYSAYGARQVSTIYTASNDYWVILEVAPAFQQDPGALSLLRVRSSNGALVPLSAVTRMSRGVGPLSVNHLGQLPSVTVSFDLQPGVSLGEGINRVNAAMAELGVPATLTGSFQGSAQAFESSLAGMGFLLVIAVVVIYIVLGILYESYVHPVTILSGLPTAGFGALLTLWLFGYDLNMYGFVGLIMLIGIVKKNAIMMVDFAIEGQRGGLDAHRAIYEACLVRFRPIMMTTLAALMGALPIALGFGAGAEARRPLGLAVVGGLLVSQLLTLYITPVIYRHLESLRAGRQRALAVPQA